MCISLFVCHSDLFKHTAHQIKVKNIIKFPSFFHLVACTGIKVGRRLLSFDLLLYMSARKCAVVFLSVPADHINADKCYIAHSKQLTPYCTLYASYRLLCLLLLLLLLTLPAHRKSLQAIHLKCSFALYACHGHKAHTHTYIHTCVHVDT